MAKIAVSNGLLTADGLAKLLGVGKSMITYYKKQGILTYVKMGKRYFYDPISVKSVIENNYKRDKEALTSN